MRIRHDGGYRFVAEARKHEIVSDQPKHGGGGDSAPIPEELLAASLGICVAVYAVAYAEKANIPFEGLEVQTEWEKERRPYRITRFRSVLTMPDRIPEEHRSLLKQFVGQCLIENTLRNPPEIEVVLQEAAGG